MFLSGIVSDSDGIHPSESNEDKTAALYKLDSGSAFIYCNQCGNESSTKRTGDFDKDKTPIYDSVLDHTHPGLTGMHTCTAMSNLFSSVFES